MSWRMSQASCSGLVFASSMIFVSMQIGTCVEVPFSTEQLLPRRTSFSRHAFSSLFVNIFVNIFLAVSISMIGLVMSTFLFQFLGFGIKMVFVFFQVLGIFLCVMILSKISSSASCTVVPACFQHS